jgi:hypothetical protein
VTVQSNATAQELAQMSGKIVAWRVRTFVLAAWAWTSHPLRPTPRRLPRRCQSAPKILDSSCPRKGSTAFAACDEKESRAASSLLLHPTFDCAQVLVEDGRTPYCSVVTLMRCPATTQLPATALALCERQSGQLSKRLGVAGVQEPAHEPTSFALSGVRSERRLMHQKAVFAH